MTRLIGIVTEKLNKLLDAVRTQVKDFNYTSHVYVNLTIAELSWLNGLHEFQEYPLFSWRGLHFEIIRFTGDAVAQFLVYLTSDLKYHVADLVKVLLYWTRNFPLQCFSPLRDYKWVPADLQETRLIVGWDDPVSGIPFGGRGGVEGQARSDIHYM